MSRAEFDGLGKSGIVNLPVYCNYIQAASTGRMKSHLGETDIIVYNLCVAKISPKSGMV